MDWKREADAVIEDVQCHVKSISVASNPQSTNLEIYFNIITIEDISMLVSMSSHGFCICSWQQPDDVQSPGQLVEDLQVNPKIYETIYSLLDDNSGKYRESISNSIASRITSIKRTRK